MVYYCVSSGVELSEQLGVDKVFDVVDHEVHDGLGHQISARFRHDFHVRVDQIADRLHLALQLRIHGRHIGLGLLKRSMKISKRIA